MANKVKFGLQNVYFAKLTESGGTITYATPVAMPGAVNLSLSIAGDSNDFYADDIVYFSASANQGYEGDLEIALMPDAFRTTILGETVDTNGAWLEDASVIPERFALGGEITGDDASRRFWFYNCSVSRPNVEASTKEASITPQTDTLSIKAMPRSTDSAVKIVMEESSTNTTAYNGFFSAVYEAQ